MGVDMMNLKQIQKEVWQNKLNKEFKKIKFQ